MGTTWVGRSPWARHAIVTAAALGSGCGATPGLVRAVRLPELPSVVAEISDR